ncbi:hypothetical protein OOP60_003517 [Salmonella enterica]|uniref:Uncharacterized protein n=3 Tax=Salmonella enterica TaxID=28901 RepID=A0A3R1B7T4_SALET|nr:hypothetical protein [Salmonella enterica]EBH8099488.1 hypothetical protein [Salmonella enterica subsp. houtenae serovar O:11:g,z25:-]EBP3998220.1 hypothetical protein [Salmonella enterica subsp. enterica]EBY1807523.1 hypothetical protein [Salmonella enterica subsp. enterica serovar Rubislaw]EDX6461604.1 hypothetical protein [Salmonella enterica subsp. diarizonae serovar 60:r:e,n,x,z15]EEJ1558258.1 hypothetical protein [Salmonella enterica subsp. houtenae]EFU5484566.1 hypothetical protein 
MNEDEKIISLLKDVLSALESVPQKAASNTHPSDTIRDLALVILEEASKKYPSSGFIDINY